MNTSRVLARSVEMVKNRGSSRDRRPRSRLIALILGTYVALLFLSRSVSTGQTIQKNTALWYCHDGALLLHAGHGNSSSNLPIDWDASALHKSANDFKECYRRASADHDSSTQLYALRGYGRAALDVAQTYNFVSLYVLIFKVSDPERKFNVAHNLSLRYIRWSIESLDDADSILASTEPDPSSPDDYTSLSDDLSAEKSTALDIKQRILATSFESLPRSKTEFVALLEAGRVPVYSMNSTWGLTKEEQCPTKGTDIAVQDVDVSAGATSVEVTVSADGTIKAAHIVASSGQSDLDEAAMTKAYGLKYHAATLHCVPVESKLVIKL